jgi:hypothetical protein
VKYKVYGVSVAADGINLRIHYHDAALNEYVSELTELYVRPSVIDSAII